MHDIFISYSHKDKTTADAICSHLEGRGMRVWYAPRDITPGDEWGVAILKGIEEAKIMVLVFTENANLSQQVLREVNNAVNAGLTIIPFRLTEEEPVAGMKYYLATVHWMDAMNEELGKSIKTLGDLCRAVLEKKAVAFEETEAAVQGGDNAAGTAVPKKSRAGLIAAVCAVAAACVIGLLVWMNSRPQTETETSVSSGSSDISDEGLQAEEDPAAEKDEEPDAAVSEDEHEETETRVISENVSMDMGETYTLGNSQSNIMNGGYLAYDGEWYYYRSNDGGKMYRMKEDGSGVTRLTETSVSYISVYDGYVYFYAEDAGLQRMKPDGSELTTISGEGNNEYVRILNDRLYLTDLHLESLALDGSDYRMHNFYAGYDACLDGIYEYFVDSNDGEILKRSKMDGSDLVCIYDHRVGSLRLAGNYLFFFQYDKECEMSYDLSTGTVKELFYGPANRPTTTKDGMYYQSGQMQLEKYSFDSGETEVVSEEWVDNINIAGNKIFYESSGKYYLIDLDGGNKTEL